MPVASRVTKHTKLTQLAPPDQRTPDFMPIDFLIVGGAITGLSAAIALSRVGHRVTVLELMESFNEVSTSRTRESAYADGMV